MPEKKKDELLHDHNHDGVDRRGFLKCMAWAGTGAFCVIQGGVLKSYSLSRVSELSAKEAIGELSFVQISDSHMGFNKPANPDVAGTLKAAVEKINGLNVAPEFMLHTGDISHLSKPEEFDTVDQILKGAKPKDVFYVPGEHDVLIDDGARDNLIGTSGHSADDAGQRNVISGSGYDAVNIDGSGTDDNVVAGNFIGTNAAGTAGLGNGGAGSGDGVIVTENAASNWIGVNPVSGGPENADQGNLISANTYAGIQLYYGSTGTVVAGNLIGTDLTGSNAIGNAEVQRPTNARNGLKSALKSFLKPLG